MTEKMITAPIKIGNWEGPAFYIDGSWYVLPKMLSDHVALDFSSQRNVIDKYFEGCLTHIKIKDQAGRLSPLVVMKAEAAVLWMAAVGRTGRTSPAGREASRQMQEALRDQLSSVVGMLLVGEASEIVGAPTAAPQRLVLPRHVSAALEQPAMRRKSGVLGGLANFFKGGRRDA